MRTNKRKRSEWLAGDDRDKKIDQPQDFEKLALMLVLPIPPVGRSPSSPHTLSPRVVRSDKPSAPLHARLSIIRIYIISASSPCNLNVVLSVVCCVFCCIVCVNIRQRPALPET